MQIPKSQQKRIKNFSKLTDNQAILQYEMNKLRSRLSKQVDYTKFIKTPKTISRSFIEEIHNIRGKKVDVFFKKFETGKPLTSYEERKQKQYERLERKTKKLTASISEDEYDYDSYYYEPDFSFDLNEEIEKEKSYESPEEYLEDTGQVVNPLTGEVISGENIADMVDFARQYLDELEQVVRMEEDRTIAGMSSYRNGRTRNARSQKWISDNVTRAGDMILRQLDNIRSSDSKMVAFAKRFSDASSLQALSDAIAEYIEGSYHVVNTSGSFQSSRVYGLLNDGPITLLDTMEFEDEE